MRKLILILAIGLSSMAAQAQGWCGTDAYLQQQIAKDPSIVQQREQLELATQKWLQKNATNRKAGTLIVIPIVFHVIHDNGVGNISYEQVKSAVDMLNEDFRRTNADTGDTRAVFKPYAADSEIEFRLAKIDPSGNCTNGVVRVHSPANTWDATNDVKTISNWPSSQYMNIWVVNTIESSSVNGIILGYAQFPGGGSSSTYGIVVRHDRTGTIGTATGDRTLTHEMGHCLNLYHTFQGGCGNSCGNSGDRVCDTPPVTTSTQGCDVNQNSCSNDMSGSSVYNSNVVDQIENYMSYDDCQNMYSLGQRDRMAAAISSTGMLTNLTSSSNLQATGVLNTPILCKADFDVDKSIACVGDYLTFKDLSYDDPTHWNWTFPGALPASGLSHTSVTQYYQPGYYSVTLAASNGSDTVSETKLQFIRILAAPGETTPVSEGFENTTEFDSKWIVSNPDNAVTWIQSGTVGHTSTKSVFLPNFTNTVSEEDELVSNTYDLTNMSNGVLKFSYAYAQKTSTDSDILKLYVSGDCGATWSLRWAKGLSSLATSSPTSSYFTPTPSQWATDSVLLSGAEFYTKSFRYKFIFKNGGGNNVYLDNINLNGVYAATPILVAPGDGSVGTSNDVTLDWKAAGVVDTYEYQVDTMSSFTSPLLVAGQNNYISPSSTGADTEFETSQLILNQKYFWRVRSITNGIASAWSPTWNFTPTYVVQTNTSVDPILANAMNLYPNPVRHSGSLMVRGFEGEKVHVRLVDQLGKVVIDKTIALTADYFTLYLPDENVASGIYTLTVKDIAKSRVSKLVVQ